MISPNQSRALSDHFERDDHLYTVAERYDVDYFQLRELADTLRPLLPGKGLDYNLILEKHPVESDRVVIHCRHVLGRLDDIYLAAYRRFQSLSSKDFVRTKSVKINTPPDWVNMSFHDAQFHIHSPDGGSNREEVTNAPYPEGTKCLDTAMRALERSMKVQLTLAKRIERLESGKSDPPQIHREKNTAQSPVAQSSVTPSPVDKSADNQAQSSDAGEAENKGFSVYQKATPYTDFKPYEIADPSAPPTITVGQAPPDEPSNEAGAHPHEAPPPSIRSPLTHDTTQNAAQHQKGRYPHEKTFTPLPGLEEEHQREWGWRKELWEHILAKHNSPADQTPPHEPATGWHALEGTPEGRGERVTLIDQQAVGQALPEGNQEVARSRSQASVERTPDVNNGTQVSVVHTPPDEPQDSVHKFPSALAGLPSLASASNDVGGLSPLHHVPKKPRFHQRE